MRSVTLPPAVGVRAGWSDLPVHVRAAIELSVGSPVVEAVNQPGGFSPGLAARVRCADGSRAFVKAAGTPLNPDTPRLHRAEARVVAGLPASLPVARLRHVHDDGEWVALVYDEVDGQMPASPWRAGDLRRVVRGLHALSEALTPAPSGVDVPSAADQLRTDLTAYARLAADPPADLTGWERRHLDRLAAAGTAVLGELSGDTLLHLDVRADNVLLGADGRVYFVDWPWACRGPAWADTALLLVNAALHGHDPERYLTGHPAFERVDPWHVTAFLIGLSGMWSEAGRKPPPPGLPTVRAFQRAHGVAALAWIRRRTGWDPG